MVLHGYCQIRKVIGSAPACRFKQCFVEESEELLEITVVRRLELVESPVICVKFNVIVDIIKPPALCINSLSWSQLVSCHWYQGSAYRG
jgi:hypothetical protein